MLHSYYYGWSMSNILLKKEDQNIKSFFGALLYILEQTIMKYHFVKMFASNTFTPAGLLGIKLHKIKLGRNEYNIN